MDTLLNIFPHLSSMRQSPSKLGGSTALLFLPVGSQNLLLQMGLTNLRPGSKRSIKKGPQNSQTRDDSKENGQPKSSKRKLQKFQKKVQFYSKVKDTSLAAKKPIQKKKRLRSRQKKLKAYDLSSLSELLPDLNAKQQLPNADAPKLKLNCKNRQKLLVMETERFKEIMSNPIFQSDPLKFIQQHLENTLPPVSNQEDKRDRTGKKDKKKRKKGSSSDTQSMDI